MYVSTFHAWMSDVCFFHGLSRVTPTCLHKPSIRLEKEEKKSAATLPTVVEPPGPFHANVLAQHYV